MERGFDQIRMVKNWRKNDLVEKWQWSSNKEKREGTVFQVKGMADRKNESMAG